MNLIKKAFALSNKNIVLLCYLILFYCLSSVYVFIAKVQNLNNNVIIFLLFCMMFIAFFSGFFNHVKYVINEEQGKMRFLEGVGEYFLPMLGVGILSLIFYIVPMYLTIFFMEKKFGNITQITDFINKLAYQSGSADNLIQNTDPVIIWQTLLLLSALWLIWGIVSFILLYWVPAVYISNKKNIIKALGTSILFLFKNFFKTLAVCVITIIIVSVISVLETITMSLPLVSALFNILSLYITVVFLFVVFIIYKDKSKTKSEV